MSITLVDVFNNSFGMGNLTDDERADGLSTYRAVMLRAHGAYGVLDVRAWIADDTDTQSTISIGFETSAADGSIQTISDESTAPADISWSEASTEETGLHVGTLDVSRNLGLWIRRVSPSSATAAARETISVGLSFWGA
jgi:hypothetical protein